MSDELARRLAHSDAPRLAPEQVAALRQVVEEYVRIRRAGLGGIHVRLDRPTEEAAEAAVAELGRWLGAADSPARYLGRRPAPGLPPEVDPS